MKLLVRYLYDNCDCVGVYEPNYRLMSFCIGEQVTKQDILELNKSKTIIDILEDGNIFIVDFVAFQYGELTPACKPHIKYIQLLKKYGLYERVCKGYKYPFERVEEKEKDIEEETNKKGLLREKEKEEKEKQKQQQQQQITDKTEDKQKNISSKLTNEEINTFEADRVFWNKFCDSLEEEKNIKLAKLEKMTESRMFKLRRRYFEEKFNFAEILKAIKLQHFLLGDNDRGWKVSFDWLIENDKNYLKVLEQQYKGGGRYGRYNATENNSDEYKKLVKQ